MPIHNNSGQGLSIAWGDSQDINVVGRKAKFAGKDKSVRDQDISLGDHIVENTLYDSAYSQIQAQLNHNYKTQEHHRLFEQSLHALEGHESVLEELSEDIQTVRKKNKSTSSKFKKTSDSVANLLATNDLDKSDSQNKDSFSTKEVIITAPSLAGKNINSEPKLSRILASEVGLDEEQKKEDELFFIQEEDKSLYEYALEGSLGAITALAQFKKEGQRASDVNSEIEPDQESSHSDSVDSAAGYDELYQKALEGNLGAITALAQFKKEGGTFNHVFHQFLQQDIGSLADKVQYGKVFALNTLHSRFFSNSRRLGSRENFGSIDIFSIGQSKDVIIEEILQFLFECGGCISTLEEFHDFMKLLSMASHITLPMYLESKIKNVILDFMDDMVNSIESVGELENFIYFVTQSILATSIQMNVNIFEDTMNELQEDDSDQESLRIKGKSPSEELKDIPVSEESLALTDEENDAHNVIPLVKKRTQSQIELVRDHVGNSKEELELHDNRVVKVESIEKTQLNIVQRGTSSRSRGANSNVQVPAGVIRGPGMMEDNNIEHDDQSKVKSLESSTSINLFLGEKESKQASFSVEETEAILSQDFLAEMDILMDY